MQQLDNIIEQNLLEQKFIYAIFSNLRRKNESMFSKVIVKPIYLRGELVFQFTYYYKKKVDHKNLKSKKAVEEMNNLLDNMFKQGYVYTVDADYQILISKKGKVKILEKNPTRTEIDTSHDKKKNYIIEENKPCDFLIKLGVMNNEGKILPKNYDKFRQINKFLEIVSDCILHLENKDNVNIIDFGCGKGYLTFALYYYFTEKLKMNVNITGIDLKKDVIEYCNKLAQELNYDKLQFVYGDIKSQSDSKDVDMVVALHACDTATDDALGKAIKWNSKVILSAPCCQHELLDKINNSTMKPMLKHGIIKERLSALITDSIRANFLEILGYSVQVLEFIDLEGTPKNMLIRAVKSNKANENAVKQYAEFKKFWDVSPYIEELMEEQLKNILY